MVRLKKNNGLEGKKNLTSGISPPHLLPAESRGSVCSRGTSRALWSYDSFSANPLTAKSPSPKLLVKGEIKNTEGMRAGEISLKYKQQYLWGGHSEQGTCIRRS